MLYVRRNEAGEIIAVSREGSEAAGWSEVSANAPDVRAFCRAMAQSDNLPGSSDKVPDVERIVAEVGATDMAFIRVLEDLINVLVDRGVIRFTDLPPAAQAKLVERQGMRSRIQRLSLLDDDESDVI